MCNNTLIINFFNFLHIFGGIFNQVLPPINLCRQHSNVNNVPEQAVPHPSQYNTAQVHSSVGSHLQHGATSAHVQHGASSAHVLNVTDKSRDTAAANTLLSLTAVNQ